MKTLQPSDLKTIIHSKRYNIFYLEFCRVLANNHTVEYITEIKKQTVYYNIPIANTTYILLGPGTSITNEAIRLLSKSGVLVGFCGGNGTPLYASTEKELDFEIVSPTSEYRPTTYLQKYIKIFFDTEKRLNAAKDFQNKRISLIRLNWENYITKYNIPRKWLETTLSEFEQDIRESTDIQALLLSEARCTKNLYKIIARALGINNFSRNKEGNSTDLQNQFLDFGNYLAYGIGATCAWVLGIPFSLSVMHGKTRRGALVFDLADIIKDGFILPEAFASAKEGLSDTEFKSKITTIFYTNEVLDIIIDTFKNMVDKYDSDIRF